MNDCSKNSGVGVRAFESNLNSLVDRIQEFGGHVVLQTTCPVLPKSSPDREPHFHKYMNANRKVAEHRHLSLVDHTRYWRENPDKHFLWMGDAFHPNVYGHRAFARLLFESLEIVDPESPTCRLHVP
jgi:hypothetical protein